MSDLFFNVGDQVELFNEYVSPGVIAEFKTLSMLFDQIRKDWSRIDVDGKYAKQRLMMKGSQSHGARSDASYPESQQSDPSETIIYIKRAQMFSMGFDGMALEAARGRGIAMKPQDFEQKGLFIGIADDLSRQLMMDGSGRLCQVDTGGSLTTHVLKSGYYAEASKFLREDRKFETYDATSGQGNSAEVNLVIDDTDITVKSGPVDLSADDYLFNVKAHADSEGMGLGEMMGLLGIISAADPPYPNAANGLQKLPVATNAAWKAWMFDNGGTPRDLEEDQWIQVLQKVERYAKVSVILVSHGVLRSWFSLLSNYKTLPNQKVMWGGWTGLPFFYKGREIPVVEDEIVPDGYALFVSNDNLVLHVLTPNMVSWERGVMGILKQVEGYNRYKAEGHMFMNLATGLRRGFGCLKDIKEP